MHDTQIAAAQNYRDGFFTVRDGLKLHYRDSPGSSDTPPMLCLRGLTRNTRDYAGLAARYSPRFRVLTLDFRGRGRSDHDPQPSRYLPPTYAYDVIELLDQLRIEQAIFVGTSLGGLVTMGLAAIAPQRIAAAILNDIGPEIADAGVQRIKSYVGRKLRFKSWDEAADSVAANNAHAFPRYERDDWLGMAKRNCREEKGEILLDYDMAIAVPFEAAAAGQQVDMWPLFLALAQKPLLVIRGERSDLLDSETALKMRAAAPQMILAEIPDVGHAPDLGEPEAVAAIDLFLASVERARA
jgi:pimeloyl-ACP methyl ester carboxylesterase